jgi:hypothetical protein
MTTASGDLPHFVRKQAELATRRLQDELNSISILVEFHGFRVLLKELKPHPTKAESLRLPLALVDYSNDGWSLLFRGNAGQWQLLPGDEKGSIEEKIQKIIDDSYGVFWRQ